MKDEGDRQAGRMLIYYSIAIDEKTLRRLPYF